MFFMVIILSYMICKCMRRGRGRSFDDYKGCYKEKKLTRRYGGRDEAQIFGIFFLFTTGDDMERKIPCKRKDRRICNGLTRTYIP